MPRNRVAVTTFGVVFTFRRVVNGFVLERSYAVTEYEYANERDLVAMRLREVRREFRRHCQLLKGGNHE